MDLCSVRLGGYHMRIHITAESTATTYYNHPTILYPRSFLTPANFPTSSYFRAWGKSKIDKCRSGTDMCPIYILQLSATSVLPIRGPQFGGLGIHSTYFPANPNIASPSRRRINSPAVCVRSAPISPRRSPSLPHIVIHQLRGLIFHFKFPTFHPLTDPGILRSPASARITTPSPDTRSPPRRPSTPQRIMVGVGCTYAGKMEKAKKQLWLCRPQFE
ncbi:hypothetical protein K438DRAFT_7518 [Mycena galopus ATCC 62051]|nr:hypothetical protein K438DRAFT_7518 [Mycena galopus ATCC 62051]